MRYTVVVSPAARRDLKRIRDTALRRIAGAIDALAADPRPHGSTKLAEDDELYRIRVGGCRVIDQIDDPRLTVLVVRVGHCGEVYRK